MASRFCQMDRRDFLARAGAAALGVGVAPAVAAGTGPPVMLRAKTGALALRPGQVETPIWLLEGQGQPLRFKRGDTLEMTLQNDAPGPVVLSWHGLDGVPTADPFTGQSQLKSGARTVFSLPLRHAGTLFGDLKLLADGGAPPSRALPLIVEESERRYAEADRDEIVLIEDFRLRPDGTTVSAGSVAKDASPVYTVNGLVWPDIAAPSNARLRLRFINACQRDVVAVKIEGLELRVMAIDGQPAEPFLARNGAIVLAPGGRTDAYVDVTLPSGSAPPLLLHDGKQAHPIGRLKVEGEVTRRVALQSAPALPSNGLPPQLDLKSAQRFDLALNGSEWIASASFATTASPAFRVKPGRVGVLALTNRAGIATVFHLHGHHFRLLDRLDDGWKPYWLDTLALQPGETQRIAFLAEFPGRYLLESTATDWAAPRLVQWYTVE
ncbi:MAG: multicopper oxidase domain-containing protein [Bradyrhizobium sp.]|nr:multicopper oxidase domain-containing protein [Bradyrhizobium sp.]